jgi:ribosomal protein S12 methylthiotransferase
MRYAIATKFVITGFAIAARNDNMLKRMQRQITQAETRELIQQIRAKIPDIAIRTTMLVGFPGETEEDFQDMCDFVQEMEFERLGVFQYSHEDDTAAFDFEDDIDTRYKRRTRQQANANSTGNFFSEK